MMLEDENEQRKIEGRKVIRKWIRPLSRRIDLLSKTDIEDIGEQSVAEAVKRIRRRRLSEFNGNEVVFTGFFSKGTSKIFAFKRKDSEILVLRIKGGQHRVLDWTLSSYERRKMMLEMAKMLCYRFHKSKNRGWYIYVGKK